MGAHCLSDAGVVSTAMKKCPFLHNIAQTHGEEYASSLACKPACPAGQSAAFHPLLSEDYDADFSSTFALFHGRGGVLPLPHLSNPAPKVLYPVELPEAASEKEMQGPRCPFGAGSGGSASTGFIVPLFAAAPLASMSMSWGSNWFNIHHLFQQHINQHRAHQRKPPQQPQQQRSSPHGGVQGPGLGGPGASGVSSSSTGSAGKCPLRRALGPLAGVVFNKQGHLVCPEPIMKMRAVLAATRPVKELRPQALPIKLLAVALTAATLNVPCGMWREHTEKFSSQWFIAVHATLPFIGMLRKAVIMPKYAILFTICAAIAGQTMGAKLERKRMVSQAKEELGGLARASAVSAGRPIAAGRQSTGLPVASMLMSAQPLDRTHMATAANGTATWMAQDGGEEPSCGPAVTAPVTAGQRQQQPQFRVRMRSGRQVGSKRDAPSVRRGGGAWVANAPVVAMLPAVAC